MKLSIIDKFRRIREVEGLTRDQMSLLIEIPSSTIKTMENRSSTPSGEVLAKVCGVYPEYALWLMTNNVNLKIGQLSPSIKKHWWTFNIDIDYLTQLKNGTAKELKEIKFDAYKYEHRIFFNNLVDKNPEIIDDAIDTTKLYERGMADML